MTDTICTRRLAVGDAVYHRGDVITDPDHAQTALTSGAAAERPREGESAPAKPRAAPASQSRAATKTTPKGKAPAKRAAKAKGA